jgi:nucleoside-diphosphate-sugar epimerase
MSRIERILLTGAGGLIGGILRRALDGGYELSGVDAVAVGGFDSLVADVADLEAILPAFQGVDAVVHLAADPGDKATWESVLRNNIVGTYNVFEAAARSGVRRIVFASSNHVTGMYERDSPYSDIVRGDYDGWTPGDYPMITHRMPVRPDGYYGVSKEYGEALGRYYFEEHGVSVACLRIGTVNREDSPLGSVRSFATLCSHRDLAQLVQRCLDAEELGFDTFYGVSNNSWRFWDINHGRDVIDYAPQDDAESYRAEFERAQR